MDSISGGFYEVEKDGKLYLVYQHPKYCPIPQTQIPTSSINLLRLLFLCPVDRWILYYVPSSNPSPEYDFHPKKNYVIPLSQSSIEVVYGNFECGICHSSFGKGHYFCKHCTRSFHKECVESPIKIKHPYHPHHMLQLTYRNSYDFPGFECLYCGRIAKCLFYHCTICQVFMHPICAMKLIPFVIDPPKNHIHPLTFFPRQTYLICNVCGFLRKNYPTYVCFRCNFVVHNDCMNYAHIIKISHHNHRISLTLSLPSREWCCGVCHSSVNNEYGAYTCEKCSDYVVHPVCATGKKVWDGKELEGVLDEGDITKDDGPFEIISQGVILYFLHKHHLRLDVSIFYDENKVCQACVLPIYEGNFYSCMENKDEFIIHEKCAKAPRRIHHALHPHPLTLGYGYLKYYSKCNACGYECGGFFYECRECPFMLDLRCASISEPFDYKGHEDPLFLALDPEVNPICHVCKTECQKQLNCIKCDFIVCFRCITLPYKAKYRHDPHFLTLSCGEEVHDKDWCEVCERNLKDTNTKVFYWCNECDTSFHIECLFSKDPYTMPNQELFIEHNFFRIVGNNSFSRPLCDGCKNHCEGKIYKKNSYYGSKYIACSLKCIIPSRL